ncbi:hypothetical protein [Roseomonas elaeocarpi]|uniref:HEAT repeat domain-containing protein n=1 Tax=Roseomonas elaeocarpi TaxID=907779 RepID=A0ABV6JQ83_9PROT
MSARIWDGDKTTPELLPYKSNEITSAISKSSADPGIAASLSHGLQHQIKNIFQNVVLASRGAAKHTSFTFTDKSIYQQLMIYNDASTDYVAFTGVIATNKDLHKSSFQLDNKMLLHGDSSHMRKAKEKWQTILADLDFRDEDSRAAAAARLRDIIEIFSDAANEILKEVGSKYDQEPEVIGFILSEVLATAGDIEDEVKVDIMSSYAASSRSSMRYEAVKALDLLQSPDAHQKLIEFRSAEQNPSVRNLLEAALRHQ